MNPEKINNPKALVFLVYVVFSGFFGGCGENEGKHPSGSDGESLVLTISQVHEEVKAHSLQYRLYCGANESDISAKIASNKPTETISDSSQITNSTLNFKSEDVKKLSSGSKCVMDIFSSDSSSHGKFKWTYFDKGNNPVKGVFYMTTPGTITNKKLSLTLFSTYINLADTFEAQVKTVYPKELASKNVTSSYLSCGSTSEQNLGVSESSNVDASGTVTHKFNLRKSDFKDNEHQCVVKSTVDGKNYKSKTSMKLAKNPEGKAIQQNTEVEIDTSAPSGSSSSSTQDVTLDLKFQNTLCETKPGVSGCISK